MHQTNNDRQNLPLAVWVLVVLCLAVVIFALCGGAAYTGIQQARLSAAKASIGQIEAVLYLAEEKAQQDGYGAPPASFENLLKSYDDASGIILSPYEDYVLKAMLESFGPNRDFDFAITRYEDGAGVHTQVYYFPDKGKTDTRKDRYYLLKGGVVTEENG